VEYHDDSDGDDMMLMVITTIRLFYRLKEIELCDEQEQLQRKLRLIRKEQSM
jgi:hypothetical protein